MTEQQAAIAVKGVKKAYKKVTVLAESKLTSLYLRLDEARNWPADDPRITQLAKGMIHTLSQYDAAPQVAGQAELTANAQVLSLINEYGVGTFPAWKQLHEVLEKLAPTQ